MQLATHTLAKVETGRLSKAVDGYTKGLCDIRVTRNTEESVEGFVKNGDNIEYSVALTPHRVFCSCKDSMFRHTICKHATVLALHVIRHPQPVPAPQPHFSLGDRVNLVNDPGWPGTVMSVSAEVVSVRWDRGGIAPVQENQIELCRGEEIFNPQLVKTRKGFAFSA